MNKIALILGVSGMDGSHLSDLLLSKNYIVYGIDRNKSEYLDSKVNFFQLDLINISVVMEMLHNVKPDEIYNFAGNSYIGNEWDSIRDDMKVFTDLTLQILEYIRINNKNIKYFYASSVEAFKHETEFSNDDMNYDLWNFYSIGKAYSHSLVKLYRNEYNVFAVNGILYPHESVRRKDHFAFKKIINGIVDIYNNKIECIELGDIHAERYWGHAIDFVNAFWLTLQHDMPDDYVIGNPEKHTIQDILEVGFGYFLKDWQNHIKISDKFKRKTNKFYGCPDITKITAIGWQPKYKFNDIVIDIIKKKLKWI